MATQEQQLEVEASFGGSDLEELAGQVKRALDIQDRRYGSPPQKVQSAKCVMLSVH